MPYPNLKESVCCLDPSRLGNQIWREAKTLISDGWTQHPAYQAWADYRPALAKYCMYGLVELYVERGTIDKSTFSQHWDFFLSFLPQKNKPHPLTTPIEWPYWVGNDDIHRSHRIALLRKGQEDETYRIFKNEKPSIHHVFPKNKTDWLDTHYQQYWEAFGIPDYNYYHQFGWTEEPSEGDPSYHWPKG